MDVEKQVAVIWAATNGYIDEVPVEKVKEYETQFISFLENAKGSLLEGIRTKKQLDDDLRSQLVAAAGEFKGRFNPKASGATA